MICFLNFKSTPTWIRAIRPNLDRGYSRLASSSADFYADSYEFVKKPMSAPAYSLRLHELWITARPTAFSLAIFIWPEVALWKLEAFFKIRSVFKRSFCMKFNLNRLH